MTFSIIIPVYNVVPYLRECLISVLQQSFPDFEAICIDDGSEDGSGLILDEFAGKDSRFRVVHQMNAGVSSARNAALDIARGDWLWFVDADDMIRPESLEVFNGLILSHPKSRMFVLRQFIRDQALKQWPVLVVRSETESHGVNEYIALHQGACNVVFSRKILKGERLEHFCVGEDVLFFSKLFWRESAILTFDAPLYFYRQREAGASIGNVSFSAVRDNLEVERRCLNMVMEHKEEWPEDERREYFKACGDYLLAMNNQKFLRISNAERARLLPAWLAIQRTSLQLGAHRRYLNVTVAVLSRIHSGFLARILIGFLVNSRNRSLSELLGVAFRRILRQGA